jgi:hypothetical protein
LIPDFPFEMYGRFSHILLTTLSQVPIHHTDLDA